MRLWLTVLLVAIVLSTIPLLQGNHYMRSAFSSLQRVVTRQAPSAGPYLAASTFRPSSTNTPYTATMTETLPQQNPMPVLSNAAPAEPSMPKELPKLSTDDFRAYNKLAIMMDAYHNHFRHTWNMLYKGASSGQRPAGASIRGFIHAGLQLCQQLTLHHTIEERHIFPELAERMPGFKDDEVLIHQHEQIHEGLEKLQGYLQGCQFGERELRMEELKTVMDGFGKVLWEHLDEEVRMLGAENMRRYWTKDEIRRMEW